MGGYPLTLEYDITYEDLKAFAKYYHFQSPAGRRRVRRIRTVVFGLAVVTQVPRVWESFADARYAAAFMGILILAATGAVASVWLTHVIVSARASGAADASFAAVGPWRLAIEQDGLLQVQPNYTALVPWRDLNRVEKTDTALYVFKGESAFTIPARAFDDRAHLEEFHTHVLQKIGEHCSV